MNSSELLIDLYSKKDFASIEQKIEQYDFNEKLYFQGKILFLKKDYKKALKIFEKIEDYYNASMCKLLMRDLKGARKILKKNSDEQITTKWLNFLLDVIEKKYNFYPSFFQVRNFLEIDLNLLFENSLLNYVEKILNASDIFVQANPEANKFFARVLYYHKYIGLSHLFLDKSLDIYFQDPETHFIKAQCFLEMENKEEAIKHLKYSLEAVENYIPALRLLEKLEKEN